MFRQGLAEPIEATKDCKPAAFLVARVFVGIRMNPNSPTNELTQTNFTLLRSITPCARVTSKVHKSPKASFLLRQGLFFRIDSRIPEDVFFRFCNKHVTVK